MMNQTLISSRAVADPGHLNLGSTGTGSKTSQGRGDLKYLPFNMHLNKGASFNLRRSLDRE
jgi:hypothetical protein